MLDFEPDNIHALSNLAHYAVISGFIEEAQEFAQDMQASGARAYEKQLKIAEALAYLGDDAGILAAYQRAEAEPGEASNSRNAARADLQTVLPYPDQSGIKMCSAQEQFIKLLLRAAVCYNEEEKYCPCDILL